MSLSPLTIRIKSISHRARILAIDCIHALAKASTLFSEVAYRVALRFDFEPDACAEELDFFVEPSDEADAFFAPFADPFATLPVELRAEPERRSPLPREAALRLCTDGARRTGSATFNNWPDRTVFADR